jgi:hypothetical protein
MAKKDKSDRIISMIRGAVYVDVVARIDGKIKELPFVKDYNDREIRDMVFDTKTPPLLGEDNAEKQQAEETPKATVPTPPVVPKDRATRQDMINALKGAGIVNIPVNNRNALERAYSELMERQKQGGDK